MGSNSSRRIIVDVLIFLSIFIAPWWLSVFFISILFFIFKPFYEGLLFGLTIDLLYSNYREIFFGLPVVFIFLVLVFLSSLLLGKYLSIKN